MNCKNIQKQFSLYQDGRLSPEMVGSLQEHLSTCSTCEAQYQELETVWALLDHHPNPEPQPYFYTRLKARMDMESESSRSFQIQRILLPVMTALMLVFGVVLGNMAGHVSTAGHVIDEDLFAELPLEELNVFSDNSMMTGILNQFSQNGGVE